MSEQKQVSFMQELDKWTGSNVIDPLRHAQARDDEKGRRICAEQIKKAIRTKVLESYRNGQQAGPRGEGRAV